VGIQFGKPTITQSLSGQEPMVNLDAAAITKRIGMISDKVERAQPPIYQAMTPPQPEAKWRRALRPR
jgi:hypothetical protein